MTTASLVAAPLTKRFMIGEAAVCLVSWTKMTNWWTANEVIGGNTKTRLAHKGYDSITDVPFPNLSDDYSIGMVKNVNISGTFSNIELRHGINQRLIYAIPSGSGTTVSGELFEQTSKTLSYLMSLKNPEQYVDNTKNEDLTKSSCDWIYNAEILTAPSTAANHTTEGNDPATATTPAKVYALPGSSSDTWVVQEDDNPDKVAIVPGGTVLITITKAFAPVLDAGTAITGTAAVTANKYRIFVPTKAGRPTVINAYKVMSLNAFNSSPEYFAMRVIGVTVDDNIPIIIDFPRVTMVKDMRIAFNAQEFQSLPMNFQAETLAVGDPMFNTWPRNAPFSVRMCAFNPGISENW